MHNIWFLLPGFTHVYNTLYMAYNGNQKFLQPCPEVMLHMYWQASKPVGVVPYLLNALRLTPLELNSQSKLELARLPIICFILGGFPLSLKLQFWELPEKSGSYCVTISPFLVKAFIITAPNYPRNEEVSFNTQRSIVTDLWQNWLDFL